MQNYPKACSIISLQRKMILSYQLLKIIKCLHYFSGPLEEILLSKSSLWNFEGTDLIGINSCQ